MSSSAGPESRQHLLRPQDLLCPPTRTPRSLRALRCMVQQPCKTSFSKDTQSVQSQCGVGQSAAGLSDPLQLAHSLAPASTNVLRVHSYTEKASCRACVVKYLYTTVATVYIKKKK